MIIVIACLIILYFVSCEMGILENKEGFRIKLNDSKYEVKPYSELEINREVDQEITEDPHSIITLENEWSRDVKGKDYVHNFDGDEKRYLIIDNNAKKWAHAHPYGEGSFKFKNFLSSNKYVFWDSYGNSRYNKPHNLRPEPTIPKIN